MAEGLVLGLTAVEGERAPLDDTFYDLAVRPTSPAWRGEEDEEAKASSGVSEIGKAAYGGCRQGTVLAGGRLRGAYPGSFEKGSPEHCQL